MFKRIDGQKIKKLDPFEKIMAVIMDKRYDAQVFFKEDVVLTKVDEYLDEKQKEGINYSYMDIIYTALVRIYSEFPKLNRFVMNGDIYQRKDIEVSMVVKPKMSNDVQESSIKIKFNGSENIDEVHQKLYKEIDIIKEQDLKDVEVEKVANFLSKVPNSLFKFTVRLLTKLDKKNLLPKSIIKASPFHASSYITNVGSLGISSVYHHLPEFGTIGIFIAIGKKGEKVTVKNGEIAKEKTLGISVVVDERLCDGMYFATAFKKFNKYIKNPYLLEKDKLKEDKEDIENLDNSKSKAKTSLKLTMIQKEN